MTPKSPSMTEVPNYAFNDDEQGDIIVRLAKPAFVARRRRGRTRFQIVKWFDPSPDDLRVIRQLVDDAAEAYSELEGRLRF